MKPLFLILLFALGCSVNIEEPREFPDVEEEPPAPQKEEPEEPVEPFNLPKEPPPCVNYHELSNDVYVVFPCDENPILMPWEPVINER